MRFAILSLVAAGALALTAGNADAQYRYRGGFGPGYYGGFNRGFYPGGGFGYPGYSYNSGFGVTIGGARGGILSFGTGPSITRNFGWGGYNNFYRPYYGGYGRGFGYGYPGWRW